MCESSPHLTARTTSSARTGFAFLDQLADSFIASSSSSTPTRSDAVSLVLEINQLLFQQTLLLQGHEDEKDEFDESPPVDKKAITDECTQRLSANLSFLATCADPRNRTRAVLPILTPPKGIESVKEPYARLAALFAKQRSPRQQPRSPIKAMSQAPPPYQTPSNPRPSRSPSNGAGLMSPPSGTPQMSFQQQQYLQQQQRAQMMGNGIYTGASPQIPMQQANAYRQEQLRQIQMQKMASMDGRQQIVGMAPSPTPYTHPPARGYGQATPQQIAMAQARMAQPNYQTMQYYQNPQGYPG